MARASRPINWLRLAALALGLKIFCSVLYQYQFYFPPDFEGGAFLIGRERLFHGWYRASFYAHLAAGPLALVLGTILMFFPRRWRGWRVHRHLGKLQVLVVVGVLAPTGIVMSTQAMYGPVAGAGFAALSVAAAWCCLAAALAAARGNMLVHRLWAGRLYLLLLSPLLLRLVVGMLIVTGYDGAVANQTLAWASWLGPLGLFEIWRRVTVGAPARLHSGSSRRALVASPSTRSRQP